jgi:hypothetical protein
MFCKHCGKKITDDSVFCPKCGNLVVESRIQTKTDSSPNEQHWISTKNLQWKKPYFARCVQIILVAAALFFAVYSLVSMIWIGENVISSGYGYGHYYMEQDPYYMAQDPWEITGFTDVDRAYSNYDCESKFRTKMWFFVHGPSLIIIGLTFFWFSRTRFPKKDNELPRDIADEIEDYQWYGFNTNKYVFFKKDGKYGIIDVCNYRVNIPAKYDAILWRIPNRTFDATSNGKTKTMSVADKFYYTDHKNDDKKKRKIILTTIGVLLSLWAAFLIIVDLIDIMIADGTANHIAIIIISSLSVVGAFFCFKKSRPKEE